MEPKKDCDNADDDHEMPGVECLDHDILPGGNLVLLEHHHDPCQGAIDLEAVLAETLYLLFRSHTVAASFASTNHGDETLLVL